ncbi:uncharacterized protein LOC133189665 [Saccostrea echinata]|uniref:uncharacterized protein LOC133189665 n=1 Tax=Saccostrea echinata TaxID=191078 RepID=UPI002A818FBC|nr:uncharacterized protein LOC133189665 [Saccostrea echinata]
MTLKERQLFVAVDKGHTKMIEILISQGASVNCRARDDGATPLIKAAKNRNHVVQKLLLQRGADITSRDALGLSAIHYTAEPGDTETLKLLLAYQSPIDTRDVEGCTPLHYAADRNNLAATEILIFCGADAYSKNKKGVCPFSINRDEAFRKIASQSRKVLEGIKNKDVIIQHDELLPGKVSFLEDIELKIFTPHNFDLTSLSFLCRRVRPEFCMESLKPVGKEILISDAFEYITSTVHVRKMVELEVPLYDHPDPYEVIQIKTNEGVIEDPSAIVEGPTTLSEHLGILRWKLRIRLDITKTKSFILITIPKMEKFPIDSSGGEFVSGVDRFINIRVAPYTFHSGTVNLEVIPTPVYKPEQYRDVLSIGHFYDLHHSLGCNKFQENGVTFTSPLPHEYENEGELCVLAADIPEDFDPDLDEALDENVWDVLKRDPKTKKGKVSCDLSHFSTHVLAEKRKGATDKDLKIQVTQLHTKALKRAKIVKFFAVIKAVPGNLYWTVLECTKPQKVKDRLNHWKAQDFIVLNPECTGEFDTYEKQEYDITLSGNIKKFSGTTKLEFHSKRDNYQHIVISMLNKEEPPCGALDVMEIPKEKEVTSIILWLSDMPVKEVPKEEDTFKGFTREKLLREIASKLGPEWVQFCVLLGVPFHKVDKIRVKSTTKSASVENKVVKILLEWRKNSQHLDDMGVVDLVTALSRVGRNDISELVHEDLSEWLKNNEFEKGDRFYKWAENAMKGTLEISKNEDYPEPMSDEFFVLLVEKFANPDFQNLGVLLGIPENQNANIFADTTFPNYQYKVLRMLIVARELHEDRMEALIDLINALQATENYDAVDWIHNCKNEWSKKNKDKRKMTKFQLDLERSIRKEAGEEDDSEVEEEEDENDEEMTPQAVHKEAGNLTSEQDEKYKSKPENKEKGDDVESSGIYQKASESTFGTSKFDESELKEKKNIGQTSDKGNEADHLSKNQSSDESDVSDEEEKADDVNLSANNTRNSESQSELAN